MISIGKKCIIISLGFVIIIPLLSKLIGSASDPKLIKQIKLPSLSDRF